MQRKVNVIEDLKENRIVVIHDVIFQGKRSVEWTDVEQYLKQFVGEEYIIEETGDLIYIGAELPDEYTHSNYTMLLRGAKYGWYKYTSRFALPVYDIMNIKKETSNLFQS